MGYDRGVNSCRQLPGRFSSVHRLQAAEENVKMCEETPYICRNIIATN